jgi:hypothetical protein
MRKSGLVTALSEMVCPEAEILAGFRQTGVEGTANFYTESKPSWFPKML